MNNKIIAIFVVVGVFAVMQLLLSISIEYRVRQKASYEWFIFVYQGGGIQTK